MADETGTEPARRPDDEGDAEVIPAMPEDGGEPADPPSPPSAVRQAAQLFIIPSLIVIAGMAAAMLFVWITTHERTIRDEVAALRGCSGTGRGPLGLQDPRYKDCWYAAYNLAGRIGQIEDQEQRATLSDELILILKQDVADAEGLLPYWLLVVIGRLGVAGAEAALLEKLYSEGPMTRQGALEGFLWWPDQEAARSDRTARRAVSAALDMLNDDPPEVVQRAAMLLGEVGLVEQDPGMQDRLAQVLERGGIQWRYARWSAAIALGRLGDARGSGIVAAVLLNREALARLSEGTRDAMATVSMPRATQDEIILGALNAAEDMTDPAVLTKIRALAEADPSPRVMKQARDLLHRLQPAIDATGTDDH